MSHSRASNGISKWNPQTSKWGAKKCLVDSLGQCVKLQTFASSNGDDFQQMIALLCCYFLLCFLFVNVALNVCFINPCVNSLSQISHL